MQPKAHNHYWEKGWAVVEGVFSCDEADRIARIALEVSKQEISDADDHYVVDASAEGRSRRAKLTGPF